MEKYRNNYEREKDKNKKIVYQNFYTNPTSGEQKSEKQYKEILMENNLILSALSLDYTTAFVLNLDTDNYKFVFNQKTNHAKMYEEIEKCTDYVKNYADNFVIEEFKEAMKHELNFLTIKRRFETENEYYFYFETEPNEAGLSCFQAHIVKEYDGEGHFAFLGFRSVDEVVKQERFYKEELRKANYALKRQLDMITNALPGGVKISNDDETYSLKYVSKQFADMLGYNSPEELMEQTGGTVVDLAHPDDLENGISEALEQYSKSDHYEITYRMKCKDGSWKYIEDRGHKFYKEDGTVEHWNLILDKNELVEKTIALESEKKANKSKSDFLSRMSHDMRTPLNGIIGLIEICLKHPEDRKLVHSSHLKARVAAEHLKSLIDDTLEFSELENKDIPLSKERFYLPSLIWEVRTISQIKADEKGINILYKGDVNRFQKPYLVGSPLYVKQILLNLIDNGIKFNKKDGNVYWSVEEKEGSDDHTTLEFVIQDTGIGMKKAFLQDIFKPFVQEDKGARSTYKGTGLGMPIVKNLLDRMNGTIEIESTEGVGTTVKFSIPFEVDKIHSETNQEEKNPNTKEKGNHKGLKILMAEDNELNREITSFILKDEGMEVTQAVDGQHALSLYLDKPECYFDAVLMDIMMPVMDGYEATNAIRNCNKKDAKTIPIIALTAKAFDEDKRKSKEAGMNAHLSKPLNVQKMIETINTFCGVGV